MKKYSNENFYVLDIETSKLEKEIDGEKIPLTTWLAYGYISKYNIAGERENTLFFRTWEQLKKRLDYINLHSNYKKLVFVHNLAFEGDFLLKNIAPVKDFCSNSTHGFISLNLCGLDKIEFRCSYRLSDMSLRELGKTIGMKKLEDDYANYLPKDKIPEKSKEYCQRDCDIVGKYIATVIKEYGSLNDIPFTKTGRVRKVMQNFYQQTETRDCKWDLMPDDKCYDLITKAFMGGITTTNPRYTGIELKKVYSYDIASSYPFVMLSEKFPSQMEYHDDILTLRELKKHKHFICKIRLKNLRSKYEWGWLASSKCDIEDEISCILWNGKILQADELITTLTDVDVENLLMVYEFENYDILESCISDEDDKLPQCYIRTIQHFARAKYNAKKEYKKNPTQENYDKMVRAKGDFNSIYGMCVQKLVQEEFTIDEFGLWEKKDKQYKQTKKHIKRNFLYGVYITAYARRNLLRGITQNCSFNFVYCDTDSIKFIGKNEFEDFNSVLEEYKDDESIYGLGRFEYEGYYQHFITFGAKKYCYKRKGKTETVVAGLPRGVPIKFEQFKCGTFWAHCKNAHVYICDDKDKIKITDEGLASDEFEIDRKYVEDFKKKNHIVSNGGVALFSVGYLLDMTDRDKNFLKIVYDREV